MSLQQVHGGFDTDSPEDEVSQVSWCPSDELTETSSAIGVGGPSMTAVMC